MEIEKSESSSCDELDAKKPARAKLLYDSHGVFYTKQEVTGNNPPKLIYPTRMSFKLHDYKDNYKRGYVTCPHCGITYNPNKKDSREFHNTQHLKLANTVNTTCIYSSIDISNAAIDTACRFFDMYDDYDTLMRAAHMLLLGCYSKFIIGNFEFMTSAKMEMDEYFAEYIAVNPEKFPESSYRSLLDMWVYKTNQTNTEFILRFDPNDPLNPIKKGSIDND